MTDQQHMNFFKIAGRASMVLELKDMINKSGYTLPQEERELQLRMISILKDLVENAGCQTSNFHLSEE